MRSLTLAALLTLAGAAHAAPALPWASGWLDPGRTMSQPYEFGWDTRSLTPPPGGWDRTPVTVPTGVVWSAAPLGPPRVTLTPGLPVQRGNVQRVPVGLRVSVPHPAVLRLGGEPGRRASFPLAVNPAVPGPPTGGPGTGFLRVGEEGRYAAQGRELELPELAGRVLTLRRVDGARAVFTVPELGEVVRVGTAGDGLPDLAPLALDPGLPALKARYEGKQVWAYGGLRGTCSPELGLSVGVAARPHDALTVRQVLRLARPLILNAGGGPGDEVGRGADALALTPLVFLVDAAPLEPSGSVGAVGPASERLREALRSGQKPDLTPRCGAQFPVMLPDTWAAERVFSLAAPSARVPRTPPPNLVGLDRWLYAWLFGFPSSDFGTRDELLKKAEWHYRNIPFPATVRFDAAGRVTAVDVPRLP